MNQESGTNALQHQLDAFFGMSIQIMGIVFLSRLILDTGTRLLYPFIPQFSAGLGLTVVGFSWLIFFRAMAGIAGPIFGVWADRYGRRKIMATGLLFQAAAVIGLAFSWQWWATAPMILFGLSMAAFIPAEQAYISDQATFERRGRALGTIEFSWAVTGIIALPIIGWMINAFGWRAPLFSLSLLSFMGSVVVWRRLPAVERRPAGLSSQPRLWEVCTRKNVIVVPLRFVGRQPRGGCWCIRRPEPNGLVLVRTSNGRVRAGGGASRGPCGSLDTRRFLYPASTSPCDF